MDATDTLPDDPAVLKQMIVQIRRETDERIEAVRQQAKEESAALVEALKQKHQMEMEALLRRFYGPKSERFDPVQLLLFGIVMDTLPVDTVAVEAESGEPLTTRRIQHKHGRSKRPESLPRIPIEHDLAPEEKKCPCCGLERCRIGQEISEQLEYVPASFKVLQHIRHKYACNPCGQGCAKCDGKPQIEIAVKAAQPIEKGLPGPGLLAYVITSKLADHLPLYRLQSIFARVDVHIARSTMCGWMFAAAELVKPLVDLMGESVRQSQVVHTDDTRVPVQREEGGPCKSGRLWAYIGDAAHPHIVVSVPQTASRTISLDILTPHFTPDGGRVLQNATTYWADQLAANPSLAQGVLTDAEYMAAQQSPAVARMAYGNSVERLVRNDLLRNPADTISPQLFRWLGGPNNPDFVNILNGELLDITTPGQVASKAGKWYGPGLVTPTYTRPAGFTIFP